MMLRFLAAITGVFFFVAPLSAQAQGAISPQDVTRFVAVAKDLKDIADRYPDVDLSADLNGPGDVAALIRDDGVFALISTLMANIPQGQMRTEIDAALRRNGFSDIANFASTGDLIMTALMALQLEGQPAPNFSAIPPEQMDQMPPQLRAQMDAVKRMVTAVRAVPQENVEAVRPFRAALEGAFGG